MVRVVNISAPDLIPPTDLWCKVGTVVPAARFCGVCLPHFLLANGFENKVTLLSRYILFVKERLKLWVQTEDDVEVAIRFFAYLVHSASYRNAGVQDLEPTGIVHVFPKTLVALCSNCSCRLIRAGGLPRVPHHKYKNNTDPND